VPEYGAARGEVPSIRPGLPARPRRSAGQVENPKGTAKTRGRSVKKVIGIIDRSKVPALGDAGREGALGGPMTAGCDSPRALERYPD
jgi:hypothetical protein